MACDKDFHRKGTRVVGPNPIPLTLCLALFLLFHLYSPYLPYPHMPFVISAGGEEPYVSRPLLVLLLLFSPLPVPSFPLPPLLHLFFLFQCFSLPPFFFILLLFIVTYSIIYALLWNHRQLAPEP